MPFQHLHDQDRELHDQDRELHDQDRELLEMAGRSNLAQSARQRFVDDAQ